jgi:RNA polymerase sigma factor (TIGR02999 family)
MRPPNPTPAVRHRGWRVARCGRILAGRPAAPAGATRSTPATPERLLQTPLDTLIRRADQADGAATDELFSLLYRELHRLAEHTVRRNGGAITLGPTTLLHEAYLNMAGRDDVAFVDRARFLAYASRVMRGLLVDYARRRGARKRGREFEITLADDAAPSTGPTQGTEELARLGDALEDLTALEPALAEVVDLHFFCGFTFAEIAALRGVSERTVQRDWRKARLLLHEALRDAAP